MIMRKPPLIPCGTPEQILSLDLIKEFIGLDPDIDAEQDNVLPVIRQAAIEQGEQITGIIWAATPYRFDGLHLLKTRGELILPLTPVFEIAEVKGKNTSGNERVLSNDEYNLLPSAIEIGRPWSTFYIGPEIVSELEDLSITFMAGWRENNFPHSMTQWALTRIATLYDHRADLATGATLAMPRHHINGLLDRWTVRDSPYA